MLFYSEVTTFLITSVHAHPGCTPVLRGVQDRLGLLLRILSLRRVE